MEDIVGGKEVHSDWVAQELKKKLIMGTQVSFLHHSKYFLILIDIKQPVSIF